ncbi:MAG: biotin/lipoyl-containing protein, partial [Thermomicrobiales bacterium]
MATVIMPKMGDAMEEGTLLKWLKNTGDEVTEGDPIAEIETDKVTLEIEVAESGFVTNTLVDEGAVVPIGTAIATIGTQDEVGKGAPAAAPEEKKEAVPAPEAMVESKQEAADTATKPPATDTAAEPQVVNRS